MPTKPTPADRPADQLRAAAELLREAAGSATPGPWRTHDTHLGGTGGHTATVLTDRPNLNDTELIAWLPTMSHEPWNEARNAWRNAGWMALLHPGVGLALAAWLDRAAVECDASVAAAANVWPDSADEAARWLAAQVPPESLAVARQLLGTTSKDTAADAQTVSYWQQKLSAVTEGRDHLKSENDRLRKELAQSERIRENADFHLGQEMARRQLAEKPTAAQPAPADRTDLPDRLRAVLTERFTARGNPFSEMRRQEKGPDGWPASHPVGPHGVAEVLRELLADGQPSARRRLTPTEHDRAWHAIEGTAGEDDADPGTVLNAVLHALRIDAPTAAEEQAASPRRRLAGEAAAGAHHAEQAGCSYRLEHRHREESTWRPNTPGIGANWSWQSREKADQRLDEARTRWPNFEHRLIETTTTVTETPAVPAAPEETR